MQQQFHNALVVDDNQICRVVGVALLNRFGLSADTATNGREALAAQSDTHFGLILMDCDMPELDGLDATLAIRQIEGLDDHALIIGVTSRANRAECLAVGMDDHIPKPLTAQALEQVMQRWGWRAIGSTDDLKSVRHSLASYRDEMGMQSDHLNEQHHNLESEKVNLGNSVWDGTSNEIAAERRRLADWEDSLKQREWALQTHERFLARREQMLSELESQKFPRAS